MLSNTYFKTRLIGVLIVINLLQINSFGQNNTDSIDEAVKQTVEDYLFLSKSYYTRSSIKALEFSQKALEIALELQRDTLLAKAYKGVGVASYYAGNNKNAIVYYDSALIYFDRTGNELEAGNVYNNLGICYNILGNRLKAIDCYLEALKIKTKLNDIASVGHISNNLGTLYYELFAFDEALKYYKEANRIAKSQIDLLGTHTATNNIGLIQQYIKDYELAKSSFLECLNLATELKDKSFYAIDCLNIGNIYISQNNADSAYFYFIKARDFFERVERPTAKIWLGIGRYYKLKNQNTKAIESFQKALIELTYQNDDILKIDLLREMYLAYENTGNIPVAYTILKQYLAVFDSIKVLFDSTALTNQRSNFELENKKREIQILQQESNNQAQQLIAYEATQKQRSILFVICVVSFMIFIILILI
ncbi:MAG: tetratricopeptide repeat protein, partial [Ignavibacteria bacterium]|nr:tetratricopeptide repeat protein [Ignavibacteria bacterium]